jgi:UDP-GalNAc:undecaprenyl-phosphate GalNAc-1-phosphate transferase
MQEQIVQSGPSRHNRWYEKLLLNPFLGHLVVFSCLLLGAQFFSYGSWVQDSNQAITLILLTLIYLIVSYLNRQITQYPGGKTIPSVFTSIIVASGLVMVIVLLFRIGYARTSLLIGIGILSFSQYIAVIINRRFRHLKFAVVPSGIALNLPQVKNVQWRWLNSPDLGDCRYDGVVVDMEQTMDDEWIRFISHCSSSGLAVVDARRVQEAVEGKVLLTQLQAMDLGALQPSPIYLSAKRAIDITVSLLLLPVLIPLCLLVIALIKMESPGPAIFVQKRVGQGNRTFLMYKFRSMLLETRSSKDPQFASEESHRITPLGSFIRKFRIDELPQFINVLKGDMSLIGPRPEQPGFVEQFEKEVPFYSYRHIIRPGITGWAQVAQGYATDTQSTWKKVEHDFYYIKHLSPSLDALILIRTIKTVITGFGAL